MLIQALLVGLVLAFCKCDTMYGYAMASRPIVVAMLTGLVLGDPVTGVIMGSVLELMFIGSFPVGAAVSPDFTSAGAICTAFAILTGGGEAVATVMALPIALLGGFIFIGCKLINAVSGQIMMRYLEKDDSKGASRIYVLGSLFSGGVIYFLYGFVCVFAGSAAVEVIVNAIPTVIINGLAASANFQENGTLFLYRFFAGGILEPADNSGDVIRGGNRVCYYRGSAKAAGGRVK